MKVQHYGKKEVGSAGDDMDELTIRSSTGDGSITFSELTDGGQNTLGSMTVALAHSGLRAVAAGVSAFDLPELADLFEELDRDWKGGQKLSWPDEDVTELRLTFTHDPAGQVSMEARVYDKRHVHSWVVQASIAIDVGSCKRIAQDLRRFAASPAAAT